MKYLVIAVGALFGLMVLVLVVFGGLYLLAHQSAG